MKKKKEKSQKYPANYNHLLGYCESKPLSKHEGIQIKSIDRLVKDGRSLNK